VKLSKNEIKGLVSKCFPDLKDNELEEFLSISEYCIVKNKEIIFKKGRTDKYVFIILKGAARAYHTNDKGVEIINHLRSDGHLFGDPAVFTGQVQKLDVQALCESHILKFNIDELEALGFKNHKLMKFYLNFLKEIIQIFSYRIDSFVAMTRKERYLSLIEMNPIYLESTFDKHIASFIGITPVTLIRIKKSIILDIK